MSDITSIGLGIVILAILVICATIARQKAAIAALKKQLSDVTSCDETLMYHLDIVRGRNKVLRDQLAELRTRLKAATEATTAAQKFSEKMGGDGP